MTTSSPTIVFEHTSTATFRAWGLAVSTALQAVGLVKHTDTGQIDWSTVTLPATGVSGGYEIYRLNDGAQSTRPVFMKIEYGTPVAASPGVWVTFSTATNGAGTMSGNIVGSRKQHYGDNVSTTAQQCYFASDGSYLTMILGRDNIAAATGNFGMYMFFDRTRDGSGTVTTDGFWYMSATSLGSTGGAGARYQATDFKGSSGGTTVFSYTVFSFRSWTFGQVGNAAGSTSVSNFLSGAAPFQITLCSAVSTAYLGDVYYFPMLITTPVLSYGSALLLGFTVDVPTNWTTTTATALGATHTYMATPIDVSGFNSSQTVRTLVRFE